MNLTSLDRESIIERLFLFELVGPFAKAEAEVQFIENYELRGAKWSIDPKKHKKSFMQELGIKTVSDLHQWRKSHMLTDECDFDAYVNYRAKRKEVINAILENVGESLYLRYKDRLDRVLYSLIRVQTEEEAYKFYYEIDANEAEFGDISAKYSCGPEAKTQGIIGPVDLTTPHPEIASRLRRAAPRQLFEPFQADQWYTIIRLEYRFESEYNDQTRQFLGALLLASKTGELSKSISQDLFQAS